MKKTGWLIFLAFFCGIFLANLLGTGDFAYDLNYLFLYEINRERFFASVLSRRIKDVLGLVVLGRIGKGKRLFWIAESILAAVFGFLSVAALVNLGVRGILMLLAGMLPHWIFYQAGIALYARYRTAVEDHRLYGSMNGKERITMAGILLVLSGIFLLGVLSESYIQPILMGLILKIF